MPRAIISLMKNILAVVITLLFIAGLGVGLKMARKEAPASVVTNFENEKSNLIRVDSPRPNQVIKSPLVIRGEARGNWYFEASFPVTLLDADGKVLVESFATAQSEWMTPEFVLYEATITFTVNKKASSNRGTLILRKDNPSGLPEHDDVLEIPVFFDLTTGGVSMPTPPLPTPPPMRACTMEAKICPDGSAVGRTGPNCEFAPCP
ncbi:MAG: Gmad2 immunoglobulin-like domain-containing protein [bacterium]|nr:Gmad2 immunoglobulin-like domain-containing protein [bacterium]